MGCVTIILPFKKGSSHYSSLRTGALQSDPLLAAEGAGKGRGRHREAPISTLVMLIVAGWRSQGSSAICGGDIRQCSEKGNPFIFREVFHSEIIHAVDHRNTCKHEI